MKNLVIALMLMSQYSMAARILTAQWNAATQSVSVNVVYNGGCAAHVFTVQWDECTDDVHRFGLVLDSGWADTCSIEQKQTFESAEPKDGCLAKALVLKSTASKVPVVVTTK